MKGNYSNLMALAEEVERMDKVKEDYVTPTHLIKMDDDGENIYIPGAGDFHLTEHAHNQVATRLKIPMKYYRRVEEIPGLRAHNVNTLFREESEKRMLRTVDGNMRAFLSDQFFPVDNILIMKAVLPVIQNRGSVKVICSALGEKRMYLQIVFQDIQSEVKKGDIVKAGITLTNSEVGAGSVGVESFVYRLECTNGLIGKHLLRKYHTGKRLEGGAGIFKADTIASDLRTFQLKLRDVMDNALKSIEFEKAVDKLRAALEDVIADTQGTVERVTKRFSTFNLGDQDALIKGIYHEREHNRFGLVQSITAMARDMENMDRAYEYEKTANEILTLSKKEWEVLSPAV